MSLSAKEAAELVGLSKAGILKAIKTGKVSASKDPNGEWCIEPVELLRTYTPVHTNGHSQVSDGTPQSVREDTPGTQREIELLQQMVRDKDGEIAHLRKLVDDEAAERRRLTALLEALAPPQRAGRSWWSKLLLGGQ